MDTMPAFEFVMRGKVDGVDISPHTIGLSQFNEFNRQVEDFIGGAEKSKLDNVQVEILNGSYVLRVIVPGALALLTSLTSDLIAMQRQDALGELDVKRADTVQKWQARAKADPYIAYQIRPVMDNISPVSITNQTDFRIGETHPWVIVEKYLLGQIVDMGGSQKANIHLRLDRSRKIITVDASQDYLREQEQNRLYHKALLHIRADQHYRTGDLRNARLIAFVDYRPEYNEDALNRFAKEGAKAWADVPDAAAWVREIRG